LQCGAQPVEQSKHDLPDDRCGDRLDGRDECCRCAAGPGRALNVEGDPNRRHPQRADDHQLRVLDVGAGVGGQLAQRRQCIAELLHRMVSVEEHLEVLFGSLGGFAEKHGQRRGPHPCQVVDQAENVGGRRVPFVADAEHGGFVALRPLVTGQVGHPLQGRRYLNAHAFVPWRCDVLC
jgi:hypothetical protein